jgi:MFS transporter, AAHS family, 4-hydroxybenzoate transporter
MPTRGWEPVFFIGGILPLIIAVMLAVWLPESMTFLVTRNWKLGKVAEIVKTIDPNVLATASTKFATDETKLAGTPVKHLFIEKRAMVTILLWVGFFCSFLVLVFVSSWIPSLLRAAGLSMSQAGLAIALNSVGSAIGSSIVGRLMDRFGRYLVLLLAFFTAAVTTGALGFATSSFGAVAIAIALSGCFAGASQSGVIALAAVTYPVAVRSTALGWAIAVGRLGAVVAPLLGGLFVAGAWPVQDILVAISCSSVVGGLAVLLLRSLAARQPDLPITATPATR